MTWAKFDDRTTEDLKIMQAGTAAYALWTASIIWCNRHLTDGVIDKRHLADIWRPTAERFQYNKAARRLTEVGLWIDEGNTFRVQNYLKYQKSKERILSERADTLERVQQFRERSKTAHRNVVTSDSCTDAPIPIQYIPAVIAPLPASVGAAVDVFENENLNLSPSPTTTTTIMVSPKPTIGVTQIADMRAKRGLEIVKPQGGDLIGYDELRRTIIHDWAWRMNVRFNPLLQSLCPVSRELVEDVRQSVEDQFKDEASGGMFVRQLERALKTPAAASMVYTAQKAKKLTQIEIMQQGAAAFLARGDSNGW